MRTADICPFNPIEPGDLKELIAKVDSGRLVMIFAEGRITENGGLMKIYEAPGLVADKSKHLLFRFGSAARNMATSPKPKENYRIVRCPKLKSQSANRGALN